MSFWEDLVRPRTTLGDIGNFFNKAITISPANFMFGQSPSAAPKPPPIQSSNLNREYDRHAAAGMIGSQPKSDMPSIAEIMANLKALQDPSRYQMSSDQLMQQAQAGANAQYDPAIAQLRQAMGATQKRGESSRQVLGQMFGQLSGSLKGEIPGIQQEYAQTQQKTGDQYAQLKNTISDTYKNTQADQEAMMQRLNIQAAAPDALANQQRDQAYFQNRANVDEQTAQTALGQEERGNVEYTRRGSDVAQVEGTQRQADLMSQLQQAMDAYQGQIGANEAAKGAAVSQMFGQLQSQATDSAFKYSQRDFDNYLASIGIGRQLQNDQIANMNKNVPTAVKSLSDIGGRAVGLGLPQQSAQKLQDVFSSAVGNDQRILGGLNPESGTPMTKEQAAQYVVEAGRQQGLSQQEINALQAMALEYFGRA